ncbi:PREDICTED: serine/threonine-rich protein adg2-like [Papilio xuthus]|uniref:Serine/threonine-rich protein adg2-like n=1 Tax=Papilio xuthus TaxID=66420 RepID=A0AAJ6ZAI6_PAPXU|nr:PREDICTED: serine/threonine-rich protein adg2-like [Papilio xuthus]
MRRAGRADTFLCVRLFCFYASIAIAAAIKYGVPIEINHWDTGRSPLKQMVDVTNEFGLKVLAEHNFLNDNNIAFSPYGLMGIMVALYEGVDGDSSYEIQRAMQLPWNRNVMRVGFRDIHRTLKTYFVPEEGFLAGLALNSENVIFEEKYTEILRFYGFDIESGQTTTPISTTTNASVTTSPTTTEIDKTSTTTLSTENTTTEKQETTTNPTEITTTEVTQETTTMSTQKIPTSTTEKSTTSQTTQANVTNGTTSATTVSNTSTTPNTTMSENIISTTESMATETTNATSGTSTSASGTTTPSTITTSSNGSTANTQNTSTSESVTTTTMALSTSASTENMENTTTTESATPSTGTTSSNGSATNTQNISTSESVTTTTMSSSTSASTENMENTTTTESATPSTGTTSSNGSTTNTQNISTSESVTTTTMSSSTSASTENMENITPAQSATPSTGATSSSGTTQNSSTSESPASSTETSSSGSTTNTTTPGSVSTSTSTTPTSDTTTVMQNTSSTETVTLSTEAASSSGSTTNMQNTTTPSNVTPSNETMSTSGNTMNNTESITNPTPVNGSMLGTARRKKSIVDYLFTNPSYVENYPVYRSFDIGPDLSDMAYGGDEQEVYFADDTKKLPPYEGYSGNQMFLANGIKNVEVTYMSYDATLDHAYLPHLDASALRLPLDSERYYLLLVLPTRRRAGELARLLARMARSSDLSDVYNALRPKRVRALVPSFFVKGHITLTTDLQRLGIRNVFQPRQNDFTPMTSQAGVYVRSIEQAVSVAIRKYSPDETKKIGHAANRQRAYFSATYPFLYFVMDANINVALMAGKLVDPLNSRIL